MIRRSQKLLLSLLFAALITGAGAAPLWANAWYTYGVNSRSTALGGAYTAACDDWACVHYNPAGLARIKASDLSLGFAYADPRLRISLPHSDQTWQSRHWATDEEVEKLSGEYLGFTLPAQYLFNVELPFKAGFGLGLFLPNHTVYGFRAYDNNKLFNVMYNERNNRVLVNAGLGVSFVDWLDIGVGFSFQQKVVGEFGVDLTLETGETITVAERTMKATDVLGSYGPIAGINIGPFFGFKFSAAYRYIFEMTDDEDEYYRNIQLGESSLVPGIFDPNKNVSLHNVGFTPQNLTLGLAFDAQILKISFDATWFDWSEYRFVRFRGKPPEPFKDIWRVAGGLEWIPAENSAIRIGVSYEPTPVSDQPVNRDYDPETAGPGETISQAPLLGNDSITASIGGGFSFFDPNELLAEPLSFDLYVASQYLVPRTYFKNSPGESYKTWGNVMLAGFSLTVRF